MTGAAGPPAADDAAAGGGLTHAGLAVYCVSGTLLTLVNKVAIQQFPLTCLLIIIQNAIAVLLLMATSAAIPGKVGALPPITAEAVKQWLPLTCLFVLMLFSSLEALKYISAVTFVVLRNLTTVVVAGGEFAYLGTRITLPALLCVASMLLGACAYGATDLAFDATGYAWLAANIVGSSVYQVYVKSLARQEGMTPTGMSYLNNAISLPVLALCSVALRELPPEPGLIDAADPLLWVGVGVAGARGYRHSTSA